MFKQRVKTRRILSRLIAALVAAAALLAATASVADGAAVPAFPAWYTGEIADSVQRLTADASVLEPSVQKILDDLGTGLDAVSDLLPVEFFHTSSGCGFIELVAEYSSDAGVNMISWYDPGHPAVVHDILPGSAVPGDSASLALDGVDSIALRLSHPPYALWYSEKVFNFDGKPHVKFYPTDDPYAFLMFWEDYPWLSDADFNDLVAILHLPEGVATVTCTPPQTLTFCDPTVLCVYFTAVRAGADSVTVEIAYDGQVETRTVASGVEDSVCVSVTETGEYSVAITPLDPCGQGETCVSGFIASINQPPVISVRDTSLFLCDFEWVCVPYVISDPDGNGPLHVDIVSGPGSIDTVRQMVIVSGNAGTKTTIVRVTDSCGATGLDTLTVIVTRNAPPAIVVGDGAPAFQCEPGEFCIDYTVSDPDGLEGLIEEIISGPPGVTIDTAANSICFLPDTSGTYQVIVQVTDTCGASGRDTSTIIVTTNDPPTITFGKDTTINQCVAAPICLGYLVTDPDGLDGLIETYVSGPGSIDTTVNTVCFTPAASGTYTIIAQVTDQCGETDTDSIVVQVNLNQPPSLSLGDDFAVFLCAPEEVCVDYVVADPDGPAGLRESYLSGPGSIDTAANRICFTPSTGDSYTIIARVTDSCGLSDEDTVTITVTINSTPSISLNNGVPVFQCEPGELCIPYTVSDADGLDGLTEELLVGPGSIDTITNEICFTPDTTGTYTIIVRVTDPCDAYDTDTIAVYAETNQPPSISFGEDFEVGQCFVNLICVPYELADPNGLAGLTETLLAGPGTSDTVGNQVCFVPDTSGVYRFIASVTDPCGETDVDTIAVSVTLNRRPSITFAEDHTSFFLCNAEEVCVAYDVDDPDGLAGLIEFLPSSSVPPSGGGDGEPYATNLNGLYIDTAANQVCFLPDTSGTYCLVVGVRDTCDSQDMDTICVTVTYNSSPAISFGGDTSVTQCAPEPICVSYTAADPDGPSGLIEDILSGPSGATIDTSANKICFTPGASDVYTVIARVTDSCGLYDTDTIQVTVTLNRPPTITLDGDLSVFLCGPEQVCVGYSVTDPDGFAGLTESLIAGAGTIDTLSNLICFTPPAAGTYTFIARVTDPCGLYDDDTVVVTVALNREPVLTFAADRSILMCAPEEICISYAVSDPDGLAGLIETQVAVPPGSVFDTLTNTVCFTPSANGVYRIIAAVKDSCLAVSVDTVNVTVDLNQGPAVTFGADFSVFQCAPTKICIGYNVSDPNITDRLTETLILNGGGGVLDTAANTVCFTPSTPGSYTFAVAVTDSCGLSDSDTITVTAAANRPPVLTVSGDQTILACASGEICVQAATVSDPDGNLDTLYVSSGAGEIDPSTGRLCFTADTAGTYCFEITAADSCGAEDVGSLCVTVTLNRAPAITLGTIAGELSFQEPTQLCLPIHTSDPDLNQQFEVSMIEGLGVFTPVTGRNVLDRSHCFTVDTTGCYQFIFEVADSCGEIDRDTTTLCVDITRPDTLFQICVDTARGISGELVSVHIQGHQLMEMGGYDFLLCYDNTALGFAGAQPESTLAYWEYFTFRTGSSAGCFTCSGGVLRFLGFADLDNGTPHPPEGAFIPKGNMIKISFYISSDRTFIGHCAPVRFCWETCADNAVSSRSGDTTYLSIDNAADSCFDGDKRNALPLIIFCDGSVCIIPPPDDRGDLNLNGIAYEVGDAVLYTNFFIYGHSVWDPIHKNSQILASDVNCDGLVLTLADLIMLIRILTNDQEPIDCPDIGAKVQAAPYAAEIIIQRADDRLDVSVNSEIDLGGVYVALSAEEGAFGEVAWADGFDGLKTEARVAGAELRALILPEVSGAGLAAGRHLLFSVPLPDGVEIRIDDTQAADFDGQVVGTDVIEAGADRPSSYRLDQNYPNPFNAGTVLRFHLGEPQEWNLTVYNILGQAVRRFSGYSPSGPSTVFWDGTSADGRVVGTGVYFARFEAGQFTATRKMVLVK